MHAARRVSVLASVAGLSALGAAAGAASGQTVLSSSGSILHTSNLGTTPPVRSTAPYTGCAVEYNGDNVLNPDDLGDFITDYFTVPPIAGPGGYAKPCPSEAPPYDDGWKCNYVPGGGTQCFPPFPDNLGDYITDYFAGCSPVPVISPLPNFTSTGSATPPLQLPLGVLTLGSGLPTTTAKAGLGTLSTSTVLGFVFATGTSLTQVNNSSVDPGTASTLTITFAGSWELSSTLGPTTVAGAGLTMTGSLPPSPVPMGGCPAGSRFSMMDLQAEFLYTLPNNTSGFMRPSINSTPFNTVVTACGPYSNTATDNQNTSPTSFPAGTVITITGSLTLSIHNDGGEARGDRLMPAGPGEGPLFVYLALPGQQPLCPADFDMDGDVDSVDANLFQNAFFGQFPGPGGYATPCPLPPPFNQGYQADFNQDCQLNLDDLAAFQNAFNQPCPPLCPADFNQDGVVDTLDFILFTDAYNNLTPGPGGYSGNCPVSPGFQADFNGDCVVDPLDEQGFMSHFNNGC